MGLGWRAPAAALLLVTLLGGCFGARAPLIGAKDSLMLFGASGAAVRVTYDSLGGPAQERIQFNWANGAYHLARGPGREPASYRLMPLEGEWYIWEKSERAGPAAYGVARLEGRRVWAYAPECVLLSEAERTGLGLALAGDGVCWLQSQEQLKAAMRQLAARRPRLIGYYEIQLVSRIRSS